jgi:hypothetical protein
MLKKKNKYLDAIPAHSVHYVHITASYELDTYRGGAHNDKDTRIEHHSYKIKTQYLTNVLSLAVSSSFSPVSAVFS